MNVAGPAGVGPPRWEGVTSPLPNLLGPPNLRNNLEIA